MDKHEADALIETIRSFVEKGQKAQAVVNQKLERPAVDYAKGNGQPFDREALYQEFKRRIIDEAKLDPVLLHLLTQQPEIIVEYEKQVETINTSTLRGRIAKLLARGFFDDPKTTGNVRTELMRTGPEPNSGGLSTALSGLLGSGFLVRAGDGWQRAPGIKVTEQRLET